MGLEFEVKVGNMTRDNGLCMCVAKPHGVTDKPLGEAIMHASEVEYMSVNEIGKEMKYLRDLLRDVCSTRDHPVTS